MLSHSPYHPPHAFPLFLLFITLTCYNPFHICRCNHHCLHIQSFHPCQLSNTCTSTNATINYTRHLCSTRLSSPIPPSLHGPTWPHKHPLYIPLTHHPYPPMSFTPSSYTHYIHTHPYLSLSTPFTLMLMLPFFTSISSWIHISCSPCTLISHWFISLHTPHPMRTPSCHPRFTHHIRHYIAHLSLISSVPFIDHQRNDMEKGQWRHVEFLLYCIIGTGISVMRTRCIHKKRKRTSGVVSGWEGRYSNGQHSLDWMKLKSRSQFIRTRILANPMVCFSMRLPPSVSQFLSKRSSMSSGMKGLGLSGMFSSMTMPARVCSYCKWAASW